VLDYRKPTFETSGFKPRVYPYVCGLPPFYEGRTVLQNIYIYVMIT